MRVAPISNAALFMLREPTHASISFLFLFFFSRPPSPSNLDSCGARERALPPMPSEQLETGLGVKLKTQTALARQLAGAVRALQTVVAF